MRFGSGGLRHVVGMSLFPRSHESSFRCRTQVARFGLLSRLSARLRCADFSLMFNLCCSLACFRSQSCFWVLVYHCDDCVMLVTGLALAQWPTAETCSAARTQQAPQGYELRSSACSYHVPVHRPLPHQLDQWLPFRDIACQGSDLCPLQKQGLEPTSYWKSPLQV